MTYFVVIINGFGLSDVNCQVLESINGYKWYNLANDVFNRGQLDSLYLCLDQARIHFEKVEDYEMVTRCENGIYYAYSYTNQMNLLKTQAYHSYNIAKEHLDVSSEVRFSATNNLGTYFYSQSDYITALHYYFKALQANKDSNHIDYESLSVNHENIGNSFYKLGDIQRAELYLLQSIELCKLDSICVRSYQLNSEYRNLATVYRKFDKFDDAEKLLRLIIDNLSPTNKYSEQEKQLEINSYLSLIEISIQQSKIKEAEKLLAKVVNLQKSYNNYQLASSYMYHAKVRLAREDQTGVLHYSHLYIKELAFRNNASDLHQLANSYREHAIYHSLYGHKDSVLVNIVKAMNVLYPIQDTFDLNYLKSFQEAERPQIARQLLREYLNVLGPTSKNNTQEHNNQLTIILTYTIPRLIQRANEHIRYEKSLFHFKHKLSREYSLYINKLLSLYDTTEDDNYLKEALLYSIRLKNSILRQKIIEAELERNLKADNSYVLQREGLRNQIKFINRQIKNGAIKEEVGAGMLFKLREEIEFRTDSLKKYHPLYNNLSRELIQIEDILKIQEILASHDACLIDYLQSDSLLYTFRLTSDKLTYSSQKYDLSIQSCAERIRQQLSIGADHQTNTANLVSLAADLHQLFKYYISPVFSNVEDINDEIFVLPDGDMNTIPMEILVTNPKMKNISFLDLDYLINEHTISYIISGSDLTLRNSNKKPIRAAFFAPDYSRTKRLNKLYYDNEKFALSNSFPTEIFDDLNVTPLFFEHEVGKYDLVHIAAHAEADLLNPSQSVIHFNSADSTTFEGSHLYAEDVLGLHLDAKLVVLNACETGKGKYYNGEGVYSFSRAFISAGAKSVIHNLWKADDNTSSSIMASFYVFLKQGMNKAEALRNAKIIFLKNSDNVAAHPSFWSNLVLVGNPHSLTNPESKRFEFIWFITGCAFLGVSILFITKYRKG